MPGKPEFDSQANGGVTAEIPPDLILRALDAAVSSPAFGKSPRPARFLRYLVETALRKEPHLLKESVLGTDVFDRPATWDPRLDPVVRQEAARLRKRLANYYEDGGADCPVRIELPVGSYVPVFRRAPAAPEPPKPLATAQPASPPSPEAPLRQPLRWPYALLGILLVAGVVVAWRAVELRSAPPSIVVLPFADLTPDPSTQYFGEGLTDELTDSLARLKTLRVIARSSAIQFKGKTTDVREVGRLLHVANVVEGTIERSGGRIRVIAHLERAADGTMIWSNTFESGTSDLFALQSEMAAGIAVGLKAASSLPATKHVPTPEAHDAVLKARYDAQQMTPDALTRAASEYRRAIELDPQYATAYLGLGISQYNQFVARGSGAQTDDERRAVEASIRKALELDPDLAAAHALLAALAMQYDWDWGRAERELQAGVSGASNSNAESYYSMLLIFRGRFAEADQHIQRMLDLDPFATATMNNLAVARILEGRLVEAREAAQRMAAQYPKALPAQQLIGMTYMGEGRTNQAMSVFQALEPRFPQIKIFEAVAQAADGKREEALRLIRPYEADYANSGVSMQWFAMVYSRLGDEASTVKWLERSADRHEWQVLNLAVNPMFAKMQKSAGFVALKKRLGL